MYPISTTKIIYGIYILYIYIYMLKLVTIFLWMWLPNITILIKRLGSILNKPSPIQAYVLNLKQNISTYNEKKRNCVNKMIGNIYLLLNNQECKRRSSAISEIKLLSSHGRLFNNINRINIINNIFNNT